MVKGMVVFMAFSSYNFFTQWHGPGYGMGSWGWGYGMGWFGMIIMAVFWVALIVGVVFLIRWLVTSRSEWGRDVKSQESALEILKKRYARGEIGKEEFEEKRKDLT
jgi:putative membrane protein